MKTYFNPTTEIVEIEAKWMLCSGEGSNPDVGNPGDKFAPARKVF
jgi:hypothetical protein